MSCTSCEHLANVSDLSTPYVERTCADCGRIVTLRDPGDNGHGIRVEKGDQFKFPKGWLQFAANPLKGTGHFTKHGLGWFAKLIFVEEISKENEITNLLEESRVYADKILEDSELLAELDLESEVDAKEAIARLEKDQASLEWWAMLTGTFATIAKDAIEEQDARKAAWAARALERCRSMCVFKSHLEEVVWMGHSAGRLVKVIEKWYANSTNALEAYWQQLFKENPYVLNQLFSVPILFIGDNAYVGGMNIDRQDAKFVDYLYANDSSSDAILVELKTPVTRLLGGKYRKGVFKPSSELSGSVIQALDYRRELSSNIQSLLKNTDQKIEIFNPRCVVIAGNAATELDTEQKRRSFELYRASLKDLEIVTYDELFKKAEILATLFNLTAKPKET